MMPEYLEESLGSLSQALESKVIWAVRAILSAETKTTAPFEIVSTAPEGSSLYCILPTSSLRYHSQLVIGVEESGLGTLFPEEREAKVQKDAIGEMANVISGLFIAEDEFISRFGQLRPSTPFYCDGVFTDRKDWSLRGTVEANGKEIIIYFSIRELT